MRAVIQRVSHAQVSCKDQDNIRFVARIGRGVVTLLGVELGDTESQAQKLLNKIISLRIFPDAEGKMNLSLKDIGGEHLIVSQFTLMGDTNKGNRPSFTRAARPEFARSLYESFIAASRKSGLKTETGVFQADMNVELLNDGPVTLILDVAPEGRADDNKI